MMSDTYKRGRDFLGDLSVDSYVAWEVNYTEGQHAYLFGHVKIADCTRSVTLDVNTMADLAKLYVLRDHLDHFEREFRKAYKKVNIAKT